MTVPVGLVLVDVNLQNRRSSSFSQLVGAFHFEMPSPDLPTADRHSDLKVSTFQRREHPTQLTSPPRQTAAMVNIDTLFEDFVLAHEDPSGPNGYLLATCISPEPPKHDQGRLYHFRNGITAANAQTDLRYKLQYNPSLHLDKKEINTWIDIFSAYHKFVGTLLAAEELQNVGQTNEADWAQVYEDWKKVVNTMYQGYTIGVLGAWTIPCLYVAVKYLRVFAIKADQKTASQRENGMAFGGIQEADAFDPNSANDKLEDAARQINRIFGLCAGDR